MKLKYFLVPVIAFVTCATMQAQTADATSSPNPESDHQGHWRHHHAWIWNKLNLTEAQKTQIKMIREGLKGQFRPALAAALSARLKLQQDIDNNPSAITTDTTALANAESQLAQIRATELSQIKASQVLTPDQLQTLNDFQQKRQTRMQDRINKLNQPTS